MSDGEENEDCAKSLSKLRVSAVLYVNILVPSGIGIWIGSSTKLSGKATGHILLWANLVFPKARKEALGGVPAKERVAGIADTRLDCRPRTDPGGWG